MSMLRESQVRNAATRARAKFGRTNERILKEQKDPRTSRYDVFLSHSIRDADIVIGAKQLLKEVGYSVYVDWAEDPQLDRSRVNAETAQLLRARMRQCQSLLYLHTENSPNSKWMPWELGYFDGHNGNVAVLPVLKDNSPERYPEQEYLKIYHYVDLDHVRESHRKEAWINKRDNTGYMPFRKWMDCTGIWNPTTFRVRL